MCACVCVCAAREQMRDGESSMYVRAGQKEKTSSIWLLFALIIDVNLARPLPVESLAPTDLNKPNRQDRDESRQNQRQQYQSA